MSTKTQHTALPWHIDPKRSLRIVALGDTTIASTGTSDSIRDQWEANAAFIVECVNSHAALTARVAKLEKALKVTLEFSEDELESRKASFLPDPTAGEYGYLEQARGAVDVARAALAPEAE